MIKLPKLLIVTPARNEAENLPKLEASLKSQSLELISLWVIVDDHSDDKTSQIAEAFRPPFSFKVIQFHSSGKLISGAAYFSWWHGVDYGLSVLSECDYVMKLDADVELSRDYFKNLLEGFEAKIDVLGGMISGLSREQNTYVPGPVKMYSLRALNLVRSLPIATGFDVMDEVLCIQHGYATKVYSGARFQLNRPIGFSQGKLHGRYRNGLVCKWTGYAPEYFILHSLRYLFRQPYIVGSLWMIIGFLTSNKGPFPAKLREKHKEIQRARLKSIIRNPVQILRHIYGF